MALTVTIIARSLASVLLLATAVAGGKGVTGFALIDGQ
jgi:hypothetical protein